MALLVALEIADILLQGQAGGIEAHEPAGLDQARGRGLVLQDHAAEGALLLVEGLLAVVRVVDAADDGLDILARAGHGGAEALDHLGPLFAFGEEQDTQPGEQGRVEFGQVDGLGAAALGQVLAAAGEAVAGVAHPGGVLVGEPADLHLLHLAGDGEHALDVGDDASRVSFLGHWPSPGDTAV